MKLLGLIGWSGSGKTTLLTALVPRFVAQGLRVSTVKHAHHGFDLARPGKDSYRHREAGAHEVLVVSGVRFALLHELRGEEPPLPALLARLDPVDLVLVEGFKTHAFAKIEVHRPSLAKPPIWPAEPGVIAVAADAPPATMPPVPLLPLGDPPAIADWILARLADLPARADLSTSAP